MDGKRPLNDVMSRERGRPRRQSGEADNRAQMGLVRAAALDPRLRANDAKIDSALCFAGGAGKCFPLPSPVTH